METSIEFNHLALSPVLFGFFVAITTWLSYQPNQDSWSDKPRKSRNQTSARPRLGGQSYHLACLWEDVPQTALTGQTYPLASPLMTPWACLWEDAPQTALTGQAFLLMTSWACLWEDAPQTVLTGQTCQISVAEAEPVYSDKNYHQPATKKKIPQIVSQKLPWWQVLGVNPQATPLDIEANYKRLVRRWHPDLNRSEYATQVTASINAAYQEYQALQMLEEQKSESSPLVSVIQQGLKFWFSI